MKKLRFTFSTCLTWLVCGVFLTIPAQSTSDPAGWELLRPEGEEFSVRMPKGSIKETATEPYIKRELNARYYISQTPNGPVFGIVSLSGIKSNPQMYTDMQRFNSYVDAFKKLFPKKVRKTGAVRLSLVSEKNLYGHVGREYRLTVADLSGAAQTFVTRKRFYAVVYLSPGKDEAIQEQFLGSFVLPEKLPDPPPEVAAQTAPADDPKAPGPARPADAAEGGREKSTDETGEKKTDQQEPASAGGPAKRRPIAGGVLNGKALFLPKPEYPPEAINAKAAGNVTVQVTIDEAGNVTEAKAISGHPLLQPVSVTAALLAKFAPTSLMGEPVKVTGVIVYNFRQQ